MATIIDPPNSVWPNGLKVDSEGYVTFYPLGTNKVDITTITWPDGDKLISPFVYDENDKLVGFADTKAMIVSGSATTTMNYSHIEADFASIFEGKLTVNAPNATVKNFKWGEYFDFVIIDFNTTDAETINTVRTAKRVVNNELYDADDNLIGTLDTSKIKVGGIIDIEELKMAGLFCNQDPLSGAVQGLILSEFNSDLSSLRDGSVMFVGCSSLTTFTADLSSLTACLSMFVGCSSLTTFTADLSSLTDGTDMFNDCPSLTTFTANLPSLTDGSNMFRECAAITSFSSDLPSLMNGYYMFYKCSSLTSITSDLSSLTDGESMFNGCSQLTSFTLDLSNLTDGSAMFAFCENLSSFSSDLPSLTDGNTMFQYCTNLTTFTSDLSSLTEGSNMFSYCTNLESFSSNVPNLTYGNNMFKACTNLTSFTLDLSNLTDSSYMFGSCTNLTMFNVDLPSLRDGENMFEYCTNLTTFTSDLSSLTDGRDMFWDCANLTTFSSNLSSLKMGGDMFNNCKLDASSLKNIIDTINTVSSNSLTKICLGMGCDNNTEDKDLFAQEVDYADMTSLLVALQAKGWTVTAQYNGRPTVTYGLRRPSEDTLPVFVKLDESEETEDHANYTSMDGSKKYKLSWFHETTGSTEGYTQFNTLEEAIETLNIKPIERN